MADPAVGILAGFSYVLHKELRRMPHDLQLVMTGAAFIELMASRARLRLRLTRPGMPGSPVAGMRHRQLMAVQAELIAMANKAVAS